MHHGSEQQILRKTCIKYILPYKLQIIALVLLIILGVGVRNVSPLIYGTIIDAINGGDMEQLLLTLVAYFSVQTLALLLGAIEKKQGEMLTFKIENRIKKDCFSVSIHAKSIMQEQIRGGEVLSRLNGDVPTVVSFYIDTFTSIGQTVINLIFSIYFIVKISIRLSTVSLFYLPTALMVSWISRTVYRRLSKKQREINDKELSFLTETLANRSGIKALNAEPIFEKKYSNIFTLKFLLLKKAVYADNTINIVYHIITFMASAYVIYTSGLLIQQKALTLGDMVAFNTYLQLLYTSAERIMSFNINRQKAYIAASRIDYLLSMQCDSANETNSRCGLNENEMTATNLDFEYENDHLAVLKDFNFHVCGNGLYGLVGKNGSGKSTFAKLLVRFYDVQQGRITLLGKSIQDYSTDAIRSCVTYIPKEDIFIKGTLLDNFLLAKQNATLEEIIDSCEHVGIHDFIMTLPQQYDTDIGENGMVLSSGQKQLISIARALLRETKVLVFDETTANLDGQVEKNILSTLLSIKDNHIIILISHRLSTVSACDKVFVLDEGKIIEEGSPDDLKANSELFNSLFVTNSRGANLAV